MMHTICKYADETELVISDIIKRENGEEIIKVVFERPTEHGFDTLFFELPSYKIIENNGNYTERLLMLEELKSYPWQAIFDYYCLKNNVPIRESWYEIVKEYEKEVLSERM